MAVWRKALFPFQILFGTAVCIRKSLYKSGVFKRFSAPVPVVVVGNISTGGTGKTPMVDYLLSHFSKKYTLGMLSRGYGRSTKGYVKVTADSLSKNVGDEPLLLAHHHPKVAISVCEKRPQGIKQMLQDYPHLDAFILDDALQHLPLQPSFKIVLTTFQNPWFSDALLPVGNLRESASAALQADVVVVTKCPSPLDEETKNTYKTKLGIAPHQKLFFTSLKYDTHVRGATEVALSKFVQNPFMLITGIANPNTLLTFLKNQKARFTHKAYPDHHAFSNKEIEVLRNSNQPILTTEKDMMRLAPYKLKQLHYLGVHVAFQENEDRFLKTVEEALLR